LGLAITVEISTAINIVASSFREFSYAYSGDLVVKPGVAFNPLRSD
jgi:hypothetical protein